MIPNHILATFLAGTYTLLNQTSSNPAFNTSAMDTGLLTYTPSGQVSAQLCSSDPTRRPSTVVWPPPLNDTTLDHDWALAAKWALAYAGPFTVTPGGTKSQGEIRHGPVVVSNIPTMVGTTQVRSYRVYDWRRRGDGFYLQLRAGLGGGQWADLWWRRLE